MEFVSLKLKALLEAKAENLTPEENLLISGLQTFIKLKEQDPNSYVALYMWARDNHFHGPTMYDVRGYKIPQDWQTLTQVDIRQSERVDEPKRRTLLFRTPRGCALVLAPDMDMRWLPPGRWAVWERDRRPVIEEARRRPTHQESNKAEEQLKGEVNAMLDQPHGWDDLDLTRIARRYGLTDHNFFRPNYPTVPDPRHFYCWRLTRPYGIAVDATNRMEYSITLYRLQRHYGLQYINAHEHEGADWRQPLEDWVEPPQLRREPDRPVTEARRRPQHQFANKWEQQLHSEIAGMEAPVDRTTLERILARYGFEHNHTLTAPLFNRRTYLYSLRSRIVWVVGDRYQGTAFVLSRHVGAGWGFSYLFDWIDKDDFLTAYTRTGEP